MRRWKVIKRTTFLVNKACFPKIDTSRARVRFQFYSLSLSISLQIIVSNHRYVQDTFCDIPQSFLRPKDSQITAVTRSNFGQQRHSEYKHVRVVCGSFRGFKSGMETNFRIRTIASHRGNEIFVSCIRQKMHNQSDNALCT